MLKYNVLIVASSPQKNGFTELEKWQTICTFVASGVVEELGEKDKVLVIMCIWGIDYQI
jgi:hypothetical protein